MDLLAFRELFAGWKPVIGMIHMAGKNSRERIRNANRELEIYSEEGVNGAIFENYHGDVIDVEGVLNDIRNEDFPLISGVNILGSARKTYDIASRFGLSFVQFDNIENSDLSLAEYAQYRDRHEGIVSFGGVRFKYQPSTGRSLEDDISFGMQDYDVVVTTGEGTGIETPLQKLTEFRGGLGGFPLVVGAGVKLGNVYEQLKIADGAIIGSSFKPGGDTHKLVDRVLVRDLMGEVGDVRAGIR